jgi:succinate-acetate transporter protein
MQCDVHSRDSLVGRSVEVRGKRELIGQVGEYSMEEKLANPAPLGLMGFWMRMGLLNIHNAGFFPSAQ